MTRLDELMAQCQATPDSDAPRLVWADAIGGERGELVVLQCRLASGATLNRDEWRELRARERELVAANGVAWSGLADQQPSRCVFRRGFVEAAEIVCSYDSRLDPIMSLVPLARSLSNQLVEQDDGDFARLIANPRSSGLAGLRIGAHSAAAGDRAIGYLADSGITLRALCVARCTRAGARRLVDSGLLARVERLVLVFAEDGPRIAAAAPRLRALHVRALDGYAGAIPASVVELACTVSGIDEVAALAIAPTLRRLGLEAQDFLWDLEALAAFDALRALDLFAARPGRGYVSFDMELRGVIPALRELSLGRWFYGPYVESVARAIGAQLDTLHWDGPIERDRFDRDAVHEPLIAGDAHIAAQVAGEFVVGLRPPWRLRPLDYGDDVAGPWFEGGGVRIDS